MENKRIKIISTIGPVCFKESIIKKMDNSGVDFFRINMSHTKNEDLEGIVQQLRVWTSREICIDTEGAQIRTGVFYNKFIKVKSHNIVRFTLADIKGDTGTVPISVNPWEIFQPGDVLRIDFHSAIIQITKIEETNAFGRVLEGGIIGSNKGISIDREIQLPGFTIKDIRSFEIAKKLGVRTLGLSFASSANDVCKLREMFDEKVTIISKIESIKGMSRIEEICNESDAILIDRGDLSRDIPIEKISFAQNYIQKVANKNKTPVYVATNILENMVANCKPTRAEVNDITSALYSGVEGLVLAAETAIGKYPVESVRMVAGIVNEFENNLVHVEDLNYLCSQPTHRIVEPHGGELIQNYIWNVEKEVLKDLPSLDVDEEILSDIVQIAEGTFSPLKGFMGLEELFSVLDEYILLNGISWTLPVLLQVHENAAKKLPDKGAVKIKRKLDGEYYATLEITEKTKIPSMDVIAKKWFGTTDRNHPGVSHFLKNGDFLIGGKVFLFKKPLLYGSNYNLTPRQTRNIFNDFGWQNIIGFHTRNVIHKGHEHIQKEALKKTNADAIFLSPVAGKKKSGDFSMEAIIKCYQIIIKSGYYNPYGALLGTFNTYSRYSGPREAVFTAICRKNFGCNYFVIGRDHTGVGKYYSLDASQKIFDKIDINVEVLFFNSAYYCSICKSVTIGCSHSQSDAKELSGTLIRESLTNGRLIPEYLMQEDIAMELKKLYEENPSLVFVPAV